MVARAQVVHKGEGIPQCDLVDLLESTRDHANVLEALLLKVFNEESQDALMVSANLQMTVSVFAIALVLVGLEFITSLLIEWI